MYSVASHLLDGTGAQKGLEKANVLTGHSLGCWGGLAAPGASVSLYWVYMARLW